MPSTHGISALACALTLLPSFQAYAQDVPPVNSRWLSDRVFLTWSCDYFQGTNMAVVRTADGLLIIDTGLSPTMVRRQRELVERELGRRDFRYLINTHMHNDHAFANEVFPEATVVAHGNSVAALQRELDARPELLERLRRGRDRYGEWASETSPDSTDGKHAREGVAAFGMGIADLEAGFTPRFPTVTFENRHTLPFGDVRFELFDFTGLHSESDILILVPEERMLFTGDVFWGGRLPLLQDVSQGDFQRLLDNWNAILETAPDLTTMVPGHSDVPLTVEQFREMYQYFTRLWADVRAAKEAGTPLMRFLLQHAFRERYPEVADYTFVSRDYNLHQHNVYVLWQLASR
jgi:glyoxylase-like metal-dependent hydrolase (beta-lactamase superfamily II)